LLSAAVDPRTKNLGCFDDEKAKAMRDDANAEAVALALRKREREREGKARAKQVAVAAAIRADVVVLEGDSEEIEMDVEEGGSMNIETLLSKQGGGSVSSSDDDEAEDEVESVAKVRIELESAVKKEMRSFRKMTPLDGKHCPLEWWQQHKDEYPLLSAVARKWLAVPATSASSERLFSAAGNIVTKKRNRLLSKKVGDLIFLKLCWKVLKEEGVLW
jgi:hypothetical protein